ncbi:MAG: hypothetical protein NWS60_00325 [Ilumatobacteraceae bacterium]|jgi:hypothetical protein|nr:MAG: hypothetical protein ABR56_05625 [Acidimicrobium sp. BACL27 MAG-120823-bin4]MDP4634706.1 hypothetical protein [Ilumatobacteraceae bacterium]MDP4902486.1 hypothetical protein [Ilumatobacteraceae bacterium]MDP4981076.1 hypothetical protein [Ilumatobacteraceae bacterium]HBZ61438.1 hypothetical protein [Acidimicrobium sp.]
MNQGRVVNQEGETTVVDVASNFGEFAVSLADFARATGWQLKPEGLCIDEICVPIREANRLTDGASIDLVEFARVTKQNIVFDRQRQVAALGERADSRGDSMSSLLAPDFKLPDIHGRQVSFSDFNRRKRLLLAWSSW